MSYYKTNHKQRHKLKQQQRKRNDIKKYETYLKTLKINIVIPPYEDKKSINIAFWDNQLCERGTTVSLYDYAFYNQTILGNKSYIFYDKNNKENKEKIIQKFKKYFTVHETDNFKEVDSYLLKYNIKYIYIQKAGNIDSRLSRVAKNCIHCVFNCHQPHGNIYSSIRNRGGGDV